MKKLTISLTTLLVLTTTIIGLMLLTPRVGAKRSGRSPFTALIMGENPATGTLSLGEEGWHQFTYVGNVNTRYPLDISLTVTPNDANQIQFITLNVFSVDQLESWYLQEDNLGQIFGVTTIASHNNNPNTGELRWNGQINPNQIYYIRVGNEMHLTVDYQLRLNGVDIQPAQPPTTLIASASVEDAAPATVIDTSSESAGTQAEALTPAASVAVPVEIPNGTDPNYPIEMTLASWQTNLYEGKLPAQTERWFSISPAELGSEAQQPLDLSLFFTPGNEGLAMDIFPGDYPAHWSRGEGDQIGSLGAGRWVSRDGNDLTGELIWNGSMYGSEIYYVRLRNGNPFDVDYWLFTDDVSQVVLGEESAPSPASEAVAAPAGRDAQHPLVLLNGLNEGSLTAGEDRWISVPHQDMGGNQRDILKLSLYFTPGDGNKLYQVYMDLFDAGQNQVWSSWNDLDQARNFEPGAIVARDYNLDTVEWTWNNAPSVGEEYYVRLRNVSAGPIDYWLFTDEVSPPRP